MNWGFIRLLRRNNVYKVRRVHFSVQEMSMGLVSVMLVLQCTMAHARNVLSGLSGTLLVQNVSMFVDKTPNTTKLSKNVSVLLDMAFTRVYV